MPPRQAPRHALHCDSRPRRPRWRNAQVPHWPQSRLQTIQSLLLPAENHKRTPVPCAKDLNSAESKLLETYKEVFEEKPFKAVQGLLTHIELEDCATPCKHFKPRSIPFRWREAVQDQLDNMVRKDVIEKVPVGESFPLREMAIGFATWVSVLLGTRTTSCHVAGRAWSADDRAPLAGIGKKDVRFGKTAAAKFRSTSTPRVCSWAWVRVDLRRSTKRKRERVSWSTQLELGLHIVSPASKACAWLATCTTVRSGAKERWFWGARLDVLIFRLRSYHVLILYSAECIGPKFHKTLMFLGQAGTFLSFQARRTSAKRSSTSDLTVVAGRIKKSTDLDCTQSCDEKLHFDSPLQKALARTRSTKLWLLRLRTPSHLTTPTCSSIHARSDCSTSYYNDPLHFHAQPNLPLKFFFKEALWSPPPPPPPGSEPTAHRNETRCQPSETPNLTRCAPKRNAPCTEMKRTAHRNETRCAPEWNALRTGMKHTAHPRKATSWKRAAHGKQNARPTLRNPRTERSAESEMSRTTYPLEARGTKESYLTNLSSLHLQPARPTSWWEKPAHATRKNQNQNRPLLTERTILTGRNEWTGKGGWEKCSKRSLDHAGERTTNGGKLRKRGDR